jgi:AAA+ ATPase superfamily predicted ATPase
MALGLVSKEHPYGEPASKRSIYKLEDFMFRFWYRFVFPNMSAVVAGLGSAVYDNDVKDQLNAFMGFVFEDICRQWFFKMAKSSSLPFFVGNLGRWWGTNPSTRTQEEIDIMCTRKDEAIFAECKWTNADVDIDVLYDLRRKSEIFGISRKHLYIFAKKSFSYALWKEHYERESVTLLAFSVMIDTLTESTAEPFSVHKEC